LTPFDGLTSLAAVLASGVFADGRDVSVTRFSSSSRTLSQFLPAAFRLIGRGVF
jgi:hypothetical protein